MCALRNPARWVSPRRQHRLGSVLPALCVIVLAVQGLTALFRRLAPHPPPVGVSGLHSPPLGFAFEIEPMGHVEPAQSRSRQLRLQHLAISFVGERTSVQNP